MKASLTTRSLPGSRFAFTFNWSRFLRHRAAFTIAAAGFLVGEAPAAVLFDTISRYHHIQVVDQGGIRTLSFNGSQETQMSISNPLEGHFEYTEYFHMPYLWNQDMRRVLMIGLGGGSTQRSYEHYHTNVTVETVEIDPVVVDVAKKYFGLKESPRQVIHNGDGRMFLRRTTAKFDAIILDAYATTRYGCSIPPHLTTKEFFALASEHLNTNGVLAYNVIGRTRGYRSELVGAMYRTMKEVFPEVYLFPARSSMNIVFIATKAPSKFTAEDMRREGGVLMQNGVIQLPNFGDRLRAFTDSPPPAAARAQILTDEHAPVESLMGRE